MAELADALASGASGGNFVQVRLLLSAPQRMIFSMEEIILFLLFISSPDSKHDILI